MNMRLIAGKIGKILLFLWMFFWWGYFAWKNRIFFYAYPSLFLPWDLSCEYFPFKEMLFSLIPILAYIVTGHLFLKCFDLYIPRWASIAMSFVLGLGMITLIGEICGLCGLFYSWAILGMVLSLYVTLLVVAAMRGRNPAEELSDYKDMHVLRFAHKSLARQMYQKTILQPQNVSQSVLAFLLQLGIILILLLTFYHALLYPISYWDSLSYLGMARSLVLNHRFPVKIVAQMGTGTGSNYPQMYRRASAIPSVVAGFWSDAYAKILAPASCLFSLLLIYHIILRLSRLKLTALALSCVFITIPYGIRYFTLSSDYSLAILFTTAFLYMSMMYMETKLPSYCVLSGLIAAFACHINYLMPLLLFAWILVLFVAHRKQPELTDQQEYDEQLKDEKEGEEATEPEYIFRDKWESFGDLLKTRFFWKLVFIYMIIICPWYIRNWALTGNPVYPYFSSVFGGKNINQDVLSSMQWEWLGNGDGIDKATFYMVEQKMKEGKIPDNKRRLWIAREMDEGGIKFTLFAKLYASFYYFVTYQQWSRLLAPVFLALTLPGILFWFISSLFRKIRGTRHPKSGRIVKDLTPAHATGLVALFLFLGFFAYHYLMAGYYLYQIIPILVCMIILAFMTLEAFTGDFDRTLFYLWCFLALLFPGLPYALMNFNIPHEIQMGNKQEFPWHLSALRRPCMFPEKFYSLAFGEDEKMLDNINTTLLGKNLLTHDNRYLLYDPSIAIIHLDDWEIQKAYDMKDDKEKLALFKKMNIHFYLKIPMQEKHVILQKLGLYGWEKKGFMKPVFQAGGNTLYQLQYEPLKPPEDQTKEPVYEFSIKRKTKNP